MGKLFQPNRLEGYFNDMTGKVNWEGIVDEDGIPMNQGLGKSPIYFPSSVLQKALGHWDMWLESDKSSEEHRLAFLHLADWSIRHQDHLGGWEVWPPMGLQYASPYSAMIQGQGISVLLRAYQITENPIYKAAAIKAWELMLVPVEKGGTCRYTVHGLILEEVPLDQPNTVLNGWIFALFGLYELSLIVSEEKIRQALDDTIQALLYYLEQYLASFWSYYDTNRNVASPFYHKLHIEQIKALEAAFPKFQTRFSEVRLTMERQLNSKMQMGMAVFIKVYQKLKSPPEVLVK